MFGRGPDVKVFVQKLEISYPMMWSPKTAYFRADLGPHLKRTSKFGQFSTHKTWGLNDHFRVVLRQRIRTYNFGKRQVIRLVHRVFL